MWKGVISKGVEWTPLDGPLPKQLSPALARTIRARNFVSPSLYYSRGRAVHRVGYRRSLLCWTVSVSVNGPRPLAGKREAVKAGDALKQHNFQFDVAYTSVLSRAIRTLWLALEAVDQVWPVSPSVVVMSDTRCCKTRVRDRGVP